MQPVGTDFFHQTKYIRDLPKLLHIVNSWCLFISEEYSIACMYQSLFNHSPTEGHLSVSSLGLLQNFCEQLCAGLCVNISFCISGINAQESNF